MVALERRHSLDAVVSVADSLPPGLVEGAISRYQDVIRQNSWFFPDFRDVDISDFLERWGRVHEAYFALADDIFALLAKGSSLRSLASSALLTRVIRSETMRGWVGKRSPSGLDALLAAHTDELERLLEPIGEDAADEVFALGGVYVGDPARVTAEHEIVELFARYHREVGQELTTEMLKEPHDAALALLRGFCRYSIAEFNTKYRVLRDMPQRSSRHDMTAQQAAALVKRHLVGLQPSRRADARQLLREVQVLNYLNLNLEVKYSFKGWAGLMHILVIAACSEATNIKTDVYAMLTSLKEMGE